MIFSKILELRTNFNQFSQIRRIDWFVRFFSKWLMVWLNFLSFFQPIFDFDLVLTDFCMADLNVGLQLLFSGNIHDFKISQVNLNLFDFMSIFNCNLWRILYLFKNLVNSFAGIFAIFLKKCWADVLNVNQPLAHFFLQLFLLVDQLSKSQV